MKKVVAFFDMFDEIPDNAQYLFSKKVEVPGTQITEIASTELTILTPGTAFIHYYEVDYYDLSELENKESDALKKTITDRVKEFIHKYKISLK